MKTLRRLAPAVLGVALLASTLTSCDWPAGTRYVQSVFGEVDATRGVVYRTTTTHTGQPIELRLDVFRPRGDTATERPAVVWMFGGAWRLGNRGQLESYAVDSAKRGYVGVTIDYRIRSGEPFDLAAAALDAYDDTIAAVQWLQEHAGEYGIDRDAIVTAGHSAGAINALHSVFLPGSRGPATSPVAAAISLSGLSFNGATGDRPPILLFHGTADPIVPLTAAQGICHETRVADNFCHMVTYEGAGHGISLQYQADIAAKTADFLYEQVLLPLGYPLPAAAA